MTKKKSAKNDFHRPENGDDILRVIRLSANENIPLMNFLLARMPNKNRDNIKSYLRFKQVLVDGKIVTQFNYPLKDRQQVEIISDRIPREKQYRGLDIIFEDRYLIVINKHAGMLSMGTDSEKDKTAYSFLSRHVKKQHPDNKIFIVHRLDRDTSGLMVFAKNEKIQHLLQDNWQQAVTERTYVAVVEGEVKIKEGSVTSYLFESKALIVYSSQDPARGDKAVTQYNVLKTAKDYSLLRINPVTGRKNQIRVHMKDIGHSIAGDKKYGAKTNPIGRLGLHAKVLELVHPMTREKLRFEIPIPAKFLSLFRTHSGNSFLPHR